MVDLTPPPPQGGDEGEHDGESLGPGEAGGTDRVRCLVIHPHIKKRTSQAVSGQRDASARLDEIVGLARAIDLDICAQEVVTLNQIKPGAYFGKGQVERLDALIKGSDIDLVVIDAHLSPVQQRNLELAWDCKVLDRTGIILEIFGERARTKEGRLQVELAHMTYQRSRLVRSWTHLERQRGGAGFMGGPGERQIELDRRLIDQRIDKLKRQLKDVKRTRELHRAARRKVPYPIVALVGYTNAGKSTLFNRLTKADVFAKDQLFATLDPTMRSIKLAGGQNIILSDTVGFISDLPHELVEAFHATLEEVLEAQVVVHVRDIAHPDTEAQAQDVHDVLKELGLDEEALHGRAIEVRNKADLLDPVDHDAQINQTRRMDGKDGAVVLLSAVTGEGVHGFLSQVEAALSHGHDILDVTLTTGDGKTMAWLYAHGDVIEREDFDDGRVRLVVKISPADASRFAQLHPHV